MNTWKDLSNASRQSEIISCMVESIDMIYYLIEEGFSYPDKFDYQLHVEDHSISLYDDGCEFASANTDQFKNAGDFMKWAIEAITTYYYDENQEEEDE